MSKESKLYVGVGGVFLVAAIVALILLFTGSGGKVGDVDHARDCWAVPGIIVHGHAVHPPAISWPGYRHGDGTGAHVDGGPPCK